MQALQKLANGEGIVYVFTRLFDLYEKLKAEEVEGATISGIEKAFAEAEIQRSPDAKLTFVPFRDTAQDKIKSDNPTKVIYLEDLKRLERCVLMLGFFDGLSKDEGIGFEIGYAYGKSVPIIGVFTDFMRREYKALPGSEHITDPVILNMLTRIVQEYQVQDAGETFADQLRNSLAIVFTRLTVEVQEVLLNPSAPKVPDIPSRIDVYLDFGGGQFEWERMIQQNLADQLMSAGYTVAVSHRYNPSVVVDTPSLQWVLEQGRADISNMLSSKVVVACADMEEMSAGSAAIQGLARSQNKHVILVDTRSTDLVGDGTHRSSRNLMIDYSADKVATSYSDVRRFVDEYFGK